MHRDVAIILKCMAQIYHERDNFEQALGLYQQALTAARTSLGVHAETASIFNKLGNLYYENQDFDNAIDMYEQGLEVERSVLHNLHPNIVVTLSNLGQVRSREAKQLACSETWQKTQLPLLLDPQAERGIYRGARCLRGSTGDSTQIPRKLAPISGCDHFQHWTHQLPNTKLHQSARSLPRSSSDTSRCIWGKQSRSCQL
jgi:tetratricopeptide (TPR) repeat protein